MEAGVAVGRPRSVARWAVLGGVLYVILFVIGTIVTFSASGASGRSTVDAPIKQGVARAQIEAEGAQVISVASGVVMGNELRVGGQP